MGTCSSEVKVHDVDVNSSCIPILIVTIDFKTSKQISEVQFNQKFVVCFSFVCIQRKANLTYTTALWYRLIHLASNFNYDRVFIQRRAIFQCSFGSLWETSQCAVLRCCLFNLITQHVCEKKLKSHMFLLRIFSSQKETNSIQVVTHSGLNLNYDASTFSLVNTNIINICSVLLKTTSSCKPLGKLCHIFTVTFRNYNWKNSRWHAKDINR